MSLSRHLALAIALLLVGACGFRPLYSTPGGDGTEAASSVSRDLAAVSVDSIPDRRGQELRNRLNALLHQGDADAGNRYRLSVVLSETRRSLAVRQTGFATRSNLRMTAAYTLIDSSTGVPLLGGSIASISSYDLLDSDFPRWRRSMTRAAGWSIKSLVTCATGLPSISLRGQPMS
ncbi:MAG: hypothetical protein HC826_00405 [Rhodospirillales bacterium]|nr:hypothetical protein [Rhodospirillales bacterium]